MVEQKDCQQQETEGKLKFPSHPGVEMKILDYYILCCTTVYRQ